MMRYSKLFNFCLVALLLFTAVVLSAAPCTAGIYKYQKDGVWYYTDAPPPDMPQDSQELVESGRNAPAPSLTGTPLLVDYPAKNDIERATAATLAVKSPMGFGSGFFITPDGYILTNKHVIRSTEPQAKQNEAHFSQVDNRIEDIERQFAQEKQYMDNFRAKLNNLKNTADKETDSERKKAYTQDYQDNLKTLRDKEADYDKRRRQFEEEKKRYKSNRSSYEYSQTVANLAQSFTVILADNTELYARLVTVSQQHDLALLKIDGYQVPVLKKADTGRLAQSDPVFAIGNPIKLRNSVTSGVFSGFEQGFIQTNAQIYPGNSGGPLVNEKGEVLGINTFKKLTYKFEGLGFAIPIEVALREFSSHLPAGRP